MERAGVGSFVVQDSQAYILYLDTATHLEHWQILGMSTLFLDE